jgi:hypothetical protein
MADFMTAQHKESSHNHPRASPPKTQLLNEGVCGVIFWTFIAQ